MAVNDNNRICSPLDVLEQLNNKYPSIVCSKNHAWKVRGHVESLISDFLVTVEKAMLMTTEVILGDELVDVQNAIGIIRRT